MTPHLAETPVIETERLTLRAPAPSDLGAFTAFFASARAEFVGGPMTAKQAWFFFGTEIGHWVMRGFGMFTVTAKGDDRAIGMVGHWYPQTWPETEVGWLLFDEAMEGSGIASEAAAACVDHAWRVLNWSTVVSYIAPANARSIALAEHLGASLDDNAPLPGTDKEVLVYRHPAPEALT